MKKTAKKRVSFAKRLFKAWVKGLPANAEFNYQSVSDCVVCQFLRDTQKVIRVMAGPEDCDVYFGSRPSDRYTFVPIAPWLARALKEETKQRGQFITKQQLQGIVAADVSRR